MILELMLISTDCNQDLGFEMDQTPVTINVLLSLSMRRCRGEYLVGAVSSLCQKYKYHAR